LGNVNLDDGIILKVRIKKLSMTLWPELSLLRTGSSDRFLSTRELNFKFRKRRGINWSDERLSTQRLCSIELVT
jgi:hypothetical protein